MGEWEKSIIDTHYTNLDDNMLVCSHSDNDGMCIYEYFIS